MLPWWRLEYFKMAENSESSSDVTLQQPLVESLTSGFDITKLWPELATGAFMLDTLSPMPMNTHPRLIVHLNAKGAVTSLEYHKHLIVRDLNVRYRDAMMLDPLIPIPFPASILIRDKALIVNLGAIRMIICANQLYILSVPKVGLPSEAVPPTEDHPFVGHLSQCLAHINDPIFHSESSASEFPVGQTIASGRIVGKEFDRDMPYELRALEVALRVVLQGLRMELHELETTGYPALSRMSRAVTGKTLQEVRDLKIDLAELTKRVETLRGEVDRILRSDHDMNDLYIARRAVEGGHELPPQPKEELERAAREDAAAIASSTAAQNSMPPQSMAAAVANAAAAKAAAEGQGRSLQRSTTMETLPESSRRAMKKSRSALAAVHAMRAGKAWRMLAGSVDKGLADSGEDGSEAAEKLEASLPSTMALSPFIDPHDIEAAEDLLEAAFLNLDEILRRLTLMAEKIASDELLLRIAMDSRRNEIVALELWVSNWSMGFGFVAMISGIFGMNLIQAEWVGGSSAFFWWVIGLSILGLLLLPVSVIFYMRKRRLMLTFEAAL